MFLLLGCAHRPPGTPADTADAADTAAGTGARPCGAWSGVARVGTRWTFEPSDAYVERWGFDGSFVTEVSALSGDTVTLTQEGHYAGEDGAFDWTREDTWRCDADGAWWTASSASSRSTSSAGASEVVGERNFAPGWLVLPASLASGDTWSDAFTLEMSVNGGDPTTAEVTCDTVVTDERTTDLAGGPVHALRVEPTCVGTAGEPSWVGEGIGTVETADEVLEAYDP